MRILRIQNPVLDKIFFTRISSDYASGTSVTVESNTSFAANDFLVFGEPTEELTESKQLSSLSGTTILTLPSTLNFAHGKGTPVYKTYWNFISIERRTSSAGTFAEISQSGIQWDNPDGVTIYIDQNATDNYQYRFRFYNSSTGEYSEYSPTLEGSGFTRSQVGYMIQQVRLLGHDLERRILSDDDIMRFFNRAQDIIYSHNPTYWFLLVDTYKGGNGIATTAGTGVYSLSTYTTLGHLGSLRYRYSSGGNTYLYHLKKKSDVEFDSYVENVSNTSERDDYAKFYKLLPADSSSDQGYVQIYPITKTTGIGTLYPNYYEKMADLNSVDDKTQIPIPSLLEDFVIAQLERARGNEAKAIENERWIVNTTKNEDYVPPGLVLLDKMDGQQKRVSGQPRSLWNFAGQKAMQRLYGDAVRHDRDYVKESFMDE